MPQNWFLPLYDLKCDWSYVFGCVSKGTWSSIIQNSQPLNHRDFQITKHRPYYFKWANTTLYCFNWITMEWQLASHGGSISYSFSKNIIDFLFSLVQLRNWRIRLKPLQQRTISSVINYTVLRGEFKCGNQLLVWWFNHALSTS